MNLIFLFASFAFAAEKVVVEFYGEALWPACRSFVTGPLNQTLTADGVFDILDYRFYPWGNAFYNTSSCPYKSYSHDGIHCWLNHCGGKTPESDCFDGVPNCQHGSQECLENLVEACAKYEYPDDVYKVSVFAWCVEKSTSMDISKCAGLAGLDADKISSCVRGSDGIAANQAVAKATAALIPAHTGTPWVLVNGKQLGNTYGLLSTVCKEYAGDAPIGCKSLLSPKHNETKMCTL